MRSKSRKHIAKRQRVRIEHECELTPYPPTHVHTGGVLQKLGRTWALRLADEVEARPDGNWLMVRRWQRGKFPPDLYAKEGVS